MRPSKARAKKSRERLIRTILFYSGHLQHERERPDMERKYMNSGNWQGSKKRGRVNNLVKWDRGGGTNIQSKQARVLQYNL